MLKRVVSAFLCLLFGAACLPAGAIEEVPSVNVGGERDDSFLAYVEWDQEDDLTIEGLAYRPARTAEGALRILTGDLVVAAALGDRKELLEDRLLTAEDVCLSGAELVPSERARAAGRKASRAIPSDVEDYQAFLEQILQLHKLFMWEARNVQPKDASQAALLARCEGLADDGKALLESLNSLYQRDSYQTGLPSEEYRSDLQVFITTRMPDMGRDFLLGLDEIEKSLAADGQETSGALLHSQSAEMLRTLLERARDLDVPNTHAIQTRLDAVNQILRNEAASRIAGKTFSLASGSNEIRFTVEGVAGQASGDPVMGKMLTELTDPLQKVKRQQSGANASGKSVTITEAETATAPLSSKSASAFPLGMGADASIGQAPPSETLRVASQKELYRKGKRVLILDEAAYLHGRSLSVTVSLYNGETKPASFCVTAVAADGYVFPLDADAPVTVQAGQWGTITASTLPSAAPLLSLARSAGPSALAVKYLLTAEGKTLTDTSDAVALFPSAGWTDTWEPVQPPALEDNGLRVYALSFQPQFGKALLLLEAAKDAEWETVTVDAVYDGCRGLASRSFHLNGGERALCLLSPAGDCPWREWTGVDGIQAYFTCRTKNQQSSPYRLTLGQPTRATGAPCISPPIFQENGCNVRFLGVEEGYFPDGGALLLEVENTTDDMLYLFCANDYAYFDDQRADTLTYGAACCPGAISRVAVAVRDAEGPSFDAARRCNLRLSLYAQAGRYLREKARSSALDLPLW